MKRFAPLLMATTLGWFFYLGTFKAGKCPESVLNVEPRQTCFEISSVEPPQGPFPTEAACQAAEDNFNLGVPNPLAIRPGGLGIYEQCQGKDS